MKTKWYLGKTKGSNPERIYLEDFTWDCDWYWGGGYIGNHNLHCHFDECFLKMVDPRSHSLGNFVTPWKKLEDYEKGATVVSNGASVWEDLSFFLDDAQYDTKQWWRIKDLFKQFYALKKAAEVFQYGGHCTTNGRNPAEINLEMAGIINKHIETVIIPEIRKALDKTEA